MKHVDAAHAKKACAARDDMKRKRQRRNTIDHIRLNSNEIMAFCIRIDRDPIICKIKQMRKLKKASERIKSEERITALCFT